jgi:hypothetical protein
MPVSVVLRYEDGVWAVDSGKDGEDESEKNVLTWMVSRAGAFPFFLARPHLSSCDAHVFINLE